MDLSIVIPVYNVEAYLRDCLDSIYALKNIDKEVIIVNDGSTDSSQNIINEYKQKFPDETKVIIQNNRGLSGARNAGLLKCEGEYVSFIDSDDYINPQKFEALFIKGKKDDLDIIAGDYKYKSKLDEYTTQSMERRKVKLSLLGLVSGLKYLEESFEKKHDAVRVEVVTNFYRKSLLDSNKIFFKERLLHEDTLFMFVVMFYAKKVKYFPVDFYYYRIREGSIMRSQREKLYS